MTSAAPLLSALATVGEWFASLQPPPPRALAEELQKLLANEAGRPVADVPEVCLETGERMLGELMLSGSIERATALSLLAVDSLITYAFQAASSDPVRIEARAANAMKRIAELAERSS
ncbi:MAG: hypothetical protein ABI120_06920 [Gemmatimonadaceae bacterium]